MRGPRRTDADRRVRQCERLGRLLRLLHLIMGRGRWDADTLAEELCCSRRTIFRLFQTLSYAGVPWYFDEAKKFYRVRPGFNFPALESASPSSSRETTIDQIGFLSAARNLIKEGEQLIETIKKCCDLLENQSQLDSKI